MEDAMKRILVFWAVEDYLESRNSGPPGIERWKKRTRVSVDSVLMASGAVKDSGFRAFCECSGQDDIFPGQSVCQLITMDKIMYRIKDLIPIQYKKLLKENDYEELTTHGLIAAKVNFFCHGYTVALIRSQMEDEDMSEWAVLR